MGKIKTFLRVLKNDPKSIKRLFVANLSKTKISHLIPDKAFLKMQYKSIFGKKLDLKNPKTFNEKLQWLKLYDRNPEYCRLVDKCDVKDYIAETIGEQYVIPTLGVWDRFEDIDFDSLPNQFVLKCTHDSGSTVICRDKACFDVEVARRKLSRRLGKNLFWHGREWPYKNIKPRILAEAYMEDAKTLELRDYKFFCFDGEVKALFIATDRQKEDEEVKFDFFAPDFNWLPFKQGHPNASVKPERPEHFEEMKMLATKLSSGMPHVRVDFYEANGKVYFGEMTFFHFCGLVPFEPRDWDLKLGEYIKLPNAKL